MFNHYVTNAANKKHPAFILTVDNKYFDHQVLMHAQDGVVSAFRNPINFYPHQLFLSSVQSDLVIREREHLDESIPVLLPGDNSPAAHKKGNPNYRQLLPYIIARQMQANGEYLYFPYRRTKKVGESRLAGNGSLGYGGHVDLDDVVSQNSVIDLHTTIMLAVLREASEEFTIYDGHNDELLLEDSDMIKFGDLFILDNSNDVGKLHVGVIMLLDVPFGYTLKASEDELEHVEPATAEELLADPTFNPENWTRIYLEHVLALKNPPANEKSVLTLDHGGVQFPDVTFTEADRVALAEVNAVAGEMNRALCASAPVSEAAALRSAIDTTQLDVEVKTATEGFVDTDGRRESKVFYAHVGGTDIPLLLSDKEERHLVDLTAQAKLTPESLRAMADGLPETEAKILNNLANMVEVGQKIGAVRENGLNELEQGDELTLYKNIDWNITGDTRVE